MSQEIEKINDDLRFNLHPDKQAIKKYLDTHFEMGLTTQAIVDPIIIKLSKNPQLFDELITPLIGYDSTAFNELLKNLITNKKLPLHDYISNYVCLIDYQNFLERSLADEWAKTHRNHPDYLKYIICKRIFDEGLKPDIDTAFAYGDTYMISHHLGTLRKYYHYFSNPLSPSGWKQKPKPTDENIIKAFSDIYHERQNKIFKKALANLEELTPQIYRWLKEIQIVNYHPEYFLTNKDYFELEIDAIIHGSALAQKELINLELADQQTIEAKKRRNTPKYQEIEAAFDNLPNLPKLIKFFRPLSKEYHQDGTKKSLIELLDSLDFKIALDFELLYQAIINTPMETYSSIINSLNPTQLQLVFDTLELKKTMAPLEMIQTYEAPLLMHNQKSKILIKTNANLQL